MKLREAADSRDRAASISARDDLKALRKEYEELAARSSEIKSLLAGLATKAQEARSEHARAVKVRQAAINEAKEQSEKQLPQSSFSRDANPIRRLGQGGARRQTLIANRSRGSSAGFRPPVSRRIQQEDFESAASGGDSDESKDTSSSKPTSSNAEYATLIFSFIQVLF